MCIIAESKHDVLNVLNEVKGASHNLLKICGGRVKISALTIGDRPRFKTNRVRFE